LDLDFGFGVFLTPVTEKPVSEKPASEKLYLKNLSLKNLYLKNHREKKEQVHCLQGANPALPRGEGPLRGTLANFLLERFGMWWQLLQKKTLMTETLQLFIFGFGVFLTPVTEKHVQYLKNMSLKNQSLKKLISPDFPGMFGTRKKHPQRTAQKLPEMFPEIFPEDVS